MTLQSDCSVGIKKETDYGTAVTVDRFPEFTEQALTQKIETKDGEGLRVGKVVARQARRAVVKTTTEGSIDLEWCTKGLGVFVEAMLGSNTSTVRTGSIYQQVAVPAVTDPMPSYTIQAGVPPVGGGSTLAQTFVGQVCESWEMSAEAGGIVKLSTSWVGKEVKTDVAYAAPSYVASSHLYTFRHGAAALGVNGTATLTVPTATALGTTTATADSRITKFTLKGENSPDEGGIVFGSGGKRGRRPAYGVRKFGGSITVELTDATMRDYYLNQTPLHLVLTFTTEEVVTAGTYATLQVVIPMLILEGDVPASNKGEVIETDVDFTVLDGEVAASPLYIVQVTADTAV